MNAGRVMQVGGLPPIGIAYPPQSTGIGISVRVRPLDRE